MQLYIHKRSEEDVNANVSYNYVPRGNAEDMGTLKFKIEIFFFSGKKKMCVYVF